MRRAFALGAVVVAAAVAAAPASALPPDCAQAGATVTCTYTAGTHPFIVPVGTRWLRVVAVGGRGGGAHGRFGDVVSAAFRVATGTAFLAVVGGNGGAGTAGANGGGLGGLPLWYTILCPGGPTRICATVPAFGGGGASDLRSSGGGLASRILVAGGGGGEGFEAFAINGAVAGPGLGGPGGKGGTSAGGAGGAGGGNVCAGLNVCSPGGPGSPGVLGVGGAGADGGHAGANVQAVYGGGGGGGGGGLFGGGGGGGGTEAAGGDGGDGSSLMPVGGSLATDTMGLPLVRISYTPVPMTVADCLHGSWRNFPQFFGEHSCLSFVAHPR